MNLAGVEAAMLRVVWPDVEQYITKALDRNGARDYETESTVLGAIAQRQMQLWVLVDNGRRIGALVTRLHQAIHGMAMEVVALGAEDWAAKKHEAAIVEEVLALAREIGAVQIECHARPGLARILARHGYQRLSEHMRFQL